MESWPTPPKGARAWSALDQELVASNEKGGSIAKLEESWGSSDDELLRKR